jgi:hypothetical protein
MWHALHTPAWTGWSNEISDTLHCGHCQLKIESNQTSTESSTDARLDSVGMFVSDKKNFIKNWDEGGGTILSESDTVAVLRDPWGTKCEVVVGPFDGYSHLNIEAKDPRKLCSWYESTFGGIRSICSWDNRRLVLEYKNMSILFSQAAEMELSAGSRNLDHFCWVTTDIDYSFKHLKKIGVNFPVEPRPLRRVHIAYAEDPAGIWFELLQYPAGMQR